MVVTVLETLKHLNMDPESVTVAVQGFGNVGSVAARLASDAGMKVLAVSGSKGGIYRSDGLQIVTLEETRETPGQYLDFPGTENITNEELLELQCDILILAASENQITSRNAARIRAR